MSGNDNTSETTRVATTSPVTASATDYDIICNLTTATSVVLPAAASSITGRTYRVSALGTGVVTITVSGGGNIDTTSSVVLTGGPRHGWQGVTDGTLWYTVSTY